MKQYLFLILHIILLSFALCFSSFKAQIYSEAPLSLSEEGNILTDMIYIKFKANDILKIPYGEEYTDGNSISNNHPEIKKLFVDYCNEWSISQNEIRISKAFPRAREEETIYVNEITGDIKMLPNIANVYILRYPKPVEVEKIAAKLRTFNEVEYVHGPVQWVNCSETPNDPKYTDGSQWYLNTIQAPNAWGITTGNPVIKIAIIEGGGVEQDHEDLIVGGDGGGPFGSDPSHGTNVAGFAGAHTDNDTGIAALGWGISLLAYRPINDDENRTVLAQKIIDAADDGAKVINLSLRTVKGNLPNCSESSINRGESAVTWYKNWDYGAVSDAIVTVLGMDVVVVASAGNNAPDIGLDTPCEDVPYELWPANYPGVIGVSASQQDNSFVDFWNYGSFVDLNAPGRTDGTTGLWTTNLNNSYTNTAAGTSFSSPLVAALVGLLRSINDFLTPAEYEDIMKITADKIGSEPYVDGRNDEMGYGRINAFLAVQHASHYNLVTYGGTLTEDLIIPAGETWIFGTPGVEVVLDNDASIIVEGTLIVQGTSSNNIIFKGLGASEMGGSIIFDGSASSNSVLNYANIEYATDIQCLNGADVTIQNSTIQNCTNGIYIYNSQPIIINNDIIEQTQNGIYGEAPGMRPLIQDNVITRTSSQNFQGIWFANYTRPFITHNDVSGFHHAVYLGGGSFAIFSDDGLVTSNPNNRLINSLNGLNTGWGSRTFAGKGSLGANNSIYNNTYYDVKAYNNSTIWAQNNYWGGGQPDYYVDGSSFLNIDFILPIDPWEGPSAPISNQGDIIELAKFIPESGSNPTDGSGSDIDDLLNGLILERDGRINEAVLHYKQMVNRDAFARSALTALTSIANKFDRGELLNYFGQLLNDRADLKSTLLTLLAAMHLHRGNYDETLNIYEEIIMEFGEDYEGVSARLDKFFAVLNYAKNVRLASRLLAEIESIDITDEELLTRFEFANYLLNSRATLNKRTEFVNIITYDNKLPKEYSLSNNYPNPFNPTTIIEYSIKQDGLVSLKVYDVLGGEVVSLVNENQIAGNYSVQFDASSAAGGLPSGIYIYRLTSGSFTSSKKLILLK